VADDAASVVAAFDAGAAAAMSAERRAPGASGYGQELDGPPERDQHRRFASGHLPEEIDLGAEGHARKAAHQERDTGSFHCNGQCLLTVGGVC